MLSHQPEVSRLIHDEHVQRLADDARQALPQPRVPSPRPAELLAGLPVPPRSALDVRRRPLRVRS